MKKGYLGDIRPITSPKGSLKEKLPLRKEKLIEELERVPARKNATPIHRDPPFEPPVEETAHTGSFSWGKIISFIVLGIVIVGGAIYGLSFVFRGATVTVVPKKVSGSVELNLTLENREDADIKYEVMTLPDSLTKEVTATETDTAKQKATGEIIVYNFQTTSQQLVATTRFADPNGQVFRTTKDITVPKKTVVGGKDTPGQATVTLVADVPGESGNIPLSDFTIVAFKGTAKEKLVYGRGKTPFTGGTDGVVYRLTDEEHATVSAELETSLKAKLLEEINKQVPEGYMLLPNSLTFTPNASANKNAASPTSTVTVVYGGEERGVLVKKDGLEAALLDAIKGEESVTEDKLIFNGLENLTYTTNVDLTGELPASIAVSVSGDVSAVWNIDQAQVKALLAGTKRSMFSSKMQTVEGVASAELVLRPFWMNTLPADTGKIKVVVDEPVNR